MATDSDSTRQPYLERHAEAVVANTYLKITVVLLSVGVVGMLVLNAITVSWAKTQQHLIVRIDDVGRATPLDYSSFEYKPQDKELRYFLAEFVQSFYGRSASAAEQHYGRSLYFLDRKLTQASIEEERRTQAIAKFSNESTEEIDVVIKNVSLQNLRDKPMKANVDFEKVTYSREDHREIRREKFAGYFEFIVEENLPPSFTSVNPLGLIITYFRVDAAFG